MVRVSEELHPTVVKAMDLYSSKDWTFVKEAEGVRFSDKPSPWCNKKAVFFETKINASMDTVVSFLSQPEEVPVKERNIFKFDELISDYEVIQKVDADTQIVYTAYKSPFFGVSARDVVTLSHECRLTEAQLEKYGFAKDDKVFLQASYSQSDATPERKGFVRGETHTYVLMVVARGGDTSSCELKLVLSFDPSGMIPAKVVELSAANQMKKLIIIRSLTEQK